MISQPLQTSSRNNNWLLRHGTWCALCGAAAQVSVFFCQVSHVALSVAAFSQDECSARPGSVLIYNPQKYTAPCSWWLADAVSTSRFQKHFHTEVETCLGNYVVITSSLSVRWGGCFRFLTHTLHSLLGYTWIQPFFSALYCSVCISPLCSQSYWRGHGDPVVLVRPGGPGFSGCSSLSQRLTRYFFKYVDNKTSYWPLGAKDRKQ